MGHKRSKQGPKSVKIVKIKKTHRNTICESIFWHIYTIDICAYVNLQKFDPKYNQRAKKGQKGSKIGKKMVKIKNAHRNTIYESNFWYVYTIYICAYENLQEFDPKYNQRAKKGKKGSKIGKKL